MKHNENIQEGINFAVVILLMALFAWIGATM